MTDRLPLLLWHLGRRGGGPRYTLELARELLRRGDVDLHLAVSRQSELFAETASLGAPMLTIDTYSGLAGFVTGLARLPAIARSLCRYVETHRLPVALCTMAHLWNGFLVPSLKRGGAANCLVVHDAAPHEGDNYAVRHLMIEHDIRQADAIITLSESVRRQALERYGLAPDRVWASSIAPFRYGAEADRQARTLGKTPHRLLFFGRLLPYKGLDRLIEAMTLLHGQGVPVHLLIAGDGGVELPPLPPNVALDRRWVPESDIPSLFTDVDLVALPYQEASQSGVIPIARHLGVPSVVTPVGGLLEQVDFGQAGYVAKDTGAAALAELIRTIIADPAGYARMSAAILAGDSDALWAQAADSVVAALRAVASPPHLSLDGRGRPPLAAGG